MSEKLFFHRINASLNEQQFIFFLKLQRLWKLRGAEVVRRCLDEIVEQYKNDLEKIG